jgi:hypothetical protein
MATMGYQQAKEIRGKSLSDRIAGRLVEGQGVGSAIGKSISEGTKAKMTGIKEKLDPMNIAKFMTGGSKLGAALVGKMTGRSKEDMSYFTGVKDKKDTASKISNLESDNQSLDLLMKIYNLMSETHRADVLEKEQAKNKEEGIEASKERRHKELLKALGSVGTPTATIIKEAPKEGNGMFGGIIELIKKTIEDVMGWILEMKDFLKELFNIKSLIGLLRSVATLGLGSPLLLSIGGAVALGAFVGWVLPAIRDYDKLQHPEQYVNVPSEMVARGEAKTSGEAGAINKRKALKTYRAPEIKEMLDAGFTDKELQDETGYDKKYLTEWLKNNPQGVLQGVAVPQKVETPKEAPKAEPTNNPPPKAKELEQGPKVSAVEMKPATAQLNEKVAENAEMKLPVSAESTKVAQDINNLNVNQKNEVGVLRGAMPSVRNMEETFQRMIMYSTRIV